MERELERLNAAETFAACEAFWPGPHARETVRRLYEEACARFQDRVIVLDDDPTGVQTVHDVYVVTDWEEETIRSMLAGPDRMFFILTNSRSFSAGKTEQVHREIAGNIRRAAERTGRSFLLISRGDSTLRGHYPLETEVLRRELEAGGQPAFSGEVLCPFFREGGRFTLNGVHYVQEGEWLLPAAQTEFAKDRTFGYRHSFLPDYIREKTGGAVPAEEVGVLTLRELRSLDFDAIERKMLSAEGFRYFAADALEEADVQALAVALMRLTAGGKRYIIRSAAAVSKVFGHVADRPLLTGKEMMGEEKTAEERPGGGLVIVGSHVQKTNDQLAALRESDLRLRFLEFDVSGWNRPGALEAETKRTAALAEEAMRRGETAVVFTGRKLAGPEGASPEDLLDVSVRISDALTAVVSSLSVRPRFLIAKGGITSSDVGTKALGVKKALVQGQAAPGIPVWKTGEESRFPGLSYIIFPGNVGGRNTLREIAEKLEGK